MAIGSVTFKLFLAFPPPKDNKRFEVVTVIKSKRVPAGLWLFDKDSQDSQDWPRRTCFLDLGQVGTFKTVAQPVCQNSFTWGIYIYMYIIYIYILNEYYIIYIYIYIK